MNSYSKVVDTIKKEFPNLIVDESSPRDELRIKRKGFRQMLRYSEESIDDKKVTIEEIRKACIELVKG